MEITMQTCKMFGCERPVADRRGKPGAPARYCDDEDHNGHNMQTATRARERDDRQRRNAADAPDPELPPERQVYALTQQMARLQRQTEAVLAANAQAIRQAQEQLAGYHDPDGVEARLAQAAAEVAAARAATAAAEHAMHVALAERDAAEQAARAARQEVEEAEEARAEAMHSRGTDDKAAEVSADRDTDPGSVDVDRPPTGIAEAPRAPRCPPPVPGEDAAADDRSVKARPWCRAWERLTRRAARRAVAR